MVSAFAARLRLPLLLRHDGARSWSGCARWCRRRRACPSRRSSGGSACSRDLVAGRRRNRRDAVGRLSRWRPLRWRSRQLRLPRREPRRRVLDGERAWATTRSVSARSIRSARWVCDATSSSATPCIPRGASSSPSTTPASRSTRSSGTRHGTTSRGPTSSRGSRRAATPSASDRSPSAPLHPVPRSAASSRRCLADALRVFDVNLRQRFYDRDVIEASLALASAVKLNDEELPIVAELCGVERRAPRETLRALMARYGLRIAALTRGPRGALLLGEDEDDECSAPAVDRRGHGRRGRLLHRHDGDGRAARAATRPDQPARQRRRIVRVLPGGATPAIPDTLRTFA